MASRRSTRRWPLCRGSSRKTDASLRGKHLERFQVRGGVLTQRRELRLRKRRPGATLRDVEVSRSVAAWSAVALMGLLLQAPSIAQQNRVARASIDVSKLGPQVGEQIPDFSLRDQSGRVWTRQSILGPRGAMLVFFRSADW